MAKTKKRKHYRLDNGEGSWYFDAKKDSWKYSVTIVENDQKKRKQFYGKTKDDCLLKFAIYKEQQHSTPREYSLQSTIPEIMTIKYTNDHKKGITQESAYRRNMETVKKIEESNIGKKPIREITNGDLEEFLGEITQFSKSYINKIWLALKKAYSISKYHDLIEKNPFEDPEFKKPISQKETKKVSAFTVEEHRAFVDTLLKQKTKKGCCSYKNQFLIELSLGIRMGEINALTRNDIIFNADGSGIIKVNKTISYNKDGKAFINTKPKTKNSIRDVEFDSEIGAIIKESFDNMQPNKYDLIFYNSNTDSVISTSQVNDSFSRICKKANVRCYGQHMLRHTFATRCIESGVPAEVLSKWLGHADIITTLNTYVDVFEKHKSKFSKTSYNLSGLSIEAEKN